MDVLVTGAAGFIGYHAARLFLARGDRVLGVDVLNDYYPVALKRARLAELAAFEAFTFVQADVADPEALKAAIGRQPDVIVHLAAQAGVRYSVDNPYAYVQSNVTGQVSVFELAASLTGNPPVVYASSSSVYGASDAIPFMEDDPADRPVSVYAATKRAGELLANAYAETRGVASTGLRFFTVYGRFGRPDMAPWLFTDAILRGQPIAVFNNGDMERDFTHVSDVAAGVVAATDLMVAAPKSAAPIYNLGNSRPVRLLDFIATIERATGRSAIMEMRPKPAGDVVRTFADVTRAARDLGYCPATSLDEGIGDFVQWYRGYAGL